MWSHLPVNGPVSDPGLKAGAFAPPGSAYDGRRPSPFIPADALRRRPNPRQVFHHTQRRRAIAKDECRTDLMVHPGHPTAFSLTQAFQTPPGGGCLLALQSLSENLKGSSPRCILMNAKPLKRSNSRYTTMATNNAAM